MKRFLVTLNILLAIALVIAVIMNFNNVSKLNRLETQNQELNEKCDSLQVEYDSLQLNTDSEISALKDDIDQKQVDIKKHLSNIDKLNVDISVLEEEVEEFRILEDHSIENLKNIGIKDYTLVEKSLWDNYEIIELGKGRPWTMRFREVFLLNDKWAFARFDEGHSTGFGIYEFKIEENGEIVWKTIYERMDWEEESTAN